jgi:TolB-like protein/tetratricopeptide (TPR) repeat protein
MSGIIKGYNYDIFISYRQKDNLPTPGYGWQSKGDRWVSEFVEALKTELESTFKEEISVYFDINPDDGLLETDDVDESLKDKLKCLVFIPIISRTYCDAKSFAWEHEFKAFVEQASKDQFGLKVKLPNGNVASRVLPVRIHDLDIADIKLCESILGGLLRSVDFIYKCPGVNRPLRPSEDHPQDNISRTYYRDQINKVANSIKEIITAIVQHEQGSEEAAKEIVTPNAVPEKKKKTKIITVSIIGTVLIMLGILVITNLFKPDQQVEKSIAVLPFANLSNDPEQEYFSDGVVEAILNHLFKAGELTVISGTSTRRYKNTKLSVKEIGRELGVSAILEGSVQKIGNNVRITAQLIDTRTDAHLWSEIYDKDFSDIFSIQSEVAQNVARELKTALTAEEKEQMKKDATENMEAYNLYMKGRFFMNKLTDEGIRKGIEYFEKALAEDKDYAPAYAGLAEAYNFIIWGNTLWRTMPGGMASQEAFARSWECANKALEIDKNLAEAHTVRGVLLFQRDWKWEEARKEFLLAIEQNPNLINTHIYYAWMLDVLRENTEARKHIDIALKLDPFLGIIHELSGQFYFNEGKFRESLDAYNKALELNPQDYYYWFFFLNYLKLGEDLKVVEMLEQIMLRNSDTVISKSSPLVSDIYNRSGISGLLNWQREFFHDRLPDTGWSNATAYARIGKKDEAIYWLEKLLEASREDLYLKGFLPRINNSAEFDNVRSEPGFQAIMKKMGLSEYQTPK